MLASTVMLLASTDMLLAASTIVAFCTNELRQSWHFEPTSFDNRGILHQRASTVMAFCTNELRQSWHFAPTSFDSHARLDRHAPRLDRHAPRLDRHAPRRLENRDILHQRACNPGGFQTDEHPFSIHQQPLRGKKKIK
jgi:hypothetical protein